MTTAATPTDDGSLRTAVATEVRAWLARRRMSGAGLARALGKSQTWAARRLDGRQAFDVDDLEAVARILEVPVSAFFAPGSDSIRSAASRAGSKFESGQVIDLAARRGAAPVPHQTAGRGGENGAVA